jgi:mRNA interferase HigB
LFFTGAKRRRAGTSLTKGTLRAFWESGHPDAEQPLRTWFHMAERAQWRSMADVRRDFASADLVGGNKLVFNVGGNKYRLVCLISFGRPGLYVLWIGTHAEYDKLDVKQL